MMQKYVPKENARSVLRPMPRAWRVAELQAGNIHMTVIQYDRRGVPQCSEETEDLAEMIMLSHKALV